MNIFDCHFHIETGLENYNINVVGKNIIFNSFHSYYNFKDQRTDSDSITLIFDYKDHFGDIKDLMSAKQIAALKIHNRLQKISADDYPVLLERLVEANPTIPIIIDAFYYGDDLKCQPDLGNIISIAKKFPNIPIIVAHCGGVDVLKYFYHLKTLGNIYFDLSLSLAYLRNTSIFTDYKNLIKYVDPGKILFGTDYPTVSGKSQLDAFFEITGEMKIPEVSIEKMLFSNAHKLFKE